MSWTEKLIEQLKEDMESNFVNEFQKRRSLLSIAVSTARYKQEEKELLGTQERAEMQRDALMADDGRI